MPPNLFNTGAFGIDFAFLESFDFVEQEPAGEKTVQPLLARGLTFDLEMRRTVKQDHTGGGFVDVLATVAA